MRILGFIAACLLTLTPAAHGQEPPQAPIESDAATVAGRNVVHSLLIGSGLIEMVFDPMVQQMMPGLRQNIIGSPMYRQASRPRREALLRFVDTMPDMLRREVQSEVVVIADRAGPRLAQIMTGEELQGLAEFLRSPNSRPLFESVTQRHLSGQQKAPSQYSDEEIRIVAEFMMTPAGAAFVRHSQDVNRILDEEFAASSARMGPRLEIVVLTGLCEALESDCPQEVRERLGRI